MAQQLDLSVDCHYSEEETSPFCSAIKGDDFYLEFALATIEDDNNNNNSNEDDNNMIVTAKTASNYVDSDCSFQSLSIWDNENNESILDELPATPQKKKSRRV